MPLGVPAIRTLAGLAGFAGNRAILYFLASKRNAPMDTRTYRSHPCGAASGRDGSLPMRSRQPAACAPALHHVRAANRRTRQSRCPTAPAPVWAAPYDNMFRSTCSVRMLLWLCSPIVCQNTTVTAILAWVFLAAASALRAGLCICLRPGRSLIWAIGLGRQC